jgi:hypothetical protein
MFSQKKKIKEQETEAELLRRMAEPLAKDSNCSIETAIRFLQLTQPKKEKIY